VPLAVEVRERHNAAGLVVKKINAFRRSQVVCSPNCATTYIENNYWGEEEQQLKELLIHLYFEVAGRWVVHIGAAPRHTELQMYGGPLSDEQFWTTMKDLATRTHLSVRKFEFPALSAADVDGVDGWDMAAGAAPFEAQKSSADEQRPDGAFPVLRRDPVVPSAVPVPQGGDHAGSEALMALLANMP